MDKDQKPKFEDLPWQAQIFMIVFSIFLIVFYIWVIIGIAWVFGYDLTLFQGFLSFLIIRIIVYLIRGK